MRLQLTRLMAAAAFCMLSATALAQRPTATAQQSTTSLPPEKVAAIDAAVRSQMQQQQLIGVAVGVVYDGQTVYLNGYGQSNAERQTPVTAETVFNWASNSKPVLAVAAMQLVQQGKLDLDADIRTYVPEFPDKGTPITVRHLLCHQSGIPHYTNGQIVPLTAREFPPRAELDPVVSLNRFAASPLIFSPGQRYEYSSYAYVVLSAVVQRAGKQPLSAQLQSRIIKPLSLRSFQLDLPYTNQRFWAAGYKKNGSGIVEPVPDYAHFWKHGAGGYKANVTDFAAWAEGLLNRKLLDETTEQTMWTPQKTADGETTRYGLGFFVSGSGEGLVVSHGGSHPEARSHMLIVPARKLAVVVLTNCGHADTQMITTAIAELLK